MMKMKAIKKILISALCLMSLGCRPSSQAHPGATIGIVLYDSEDIFLQELTSNFVKEAEMHNLNIITNGSRRSQLQENRLVRDMISDGADILCVNLVDRTDTSDIINAAKQADVPVIFFNREPVKSDLDRWDRLYYVGADAAESGRLQGELAISYFHSHPEADRNGDGKIQYYVLEGETGHQDAIIRTESSVETLETASLQLDKQGYAICNWNRSDAQKAVSQLIDGNMNPELILCNNDEMAAGAVDACDQAGIPLSDRPAIFGIDGTRTGLSLVKSGKLSATVFNDYIAQAETMLDMTLRLLQNQNMSEVNLQDGKRTYLPYRKVTRSNVNDFLSLTSD
jgi:methyl-galactoside transport system substrate-binding protein